MQTDGACARQKKWQRLEIYPNPLLFFGTVELPSQYIYIYRCIYALYLHVRMWVPNLHQVGTEGCRTAGQIVGIDG